MTYQERFKGWLTIPAVKIYKSPGGDRALVKEESLLFRRKTYRKRFETLTRWHRKARRFCTVSIAKTTSKPNTIKRRRISMPLG
jgi:hypothetical protein